MCTHSSVILTSNYRYLSNNIFLTKCNESISGQQRHGLGKTQQTACLSQITPQAGLKPRTALLDNSIFVPPKKMKFWKRLQQQLSFKNNNVYRQVHSRYNSVTHICTKFHHNQSFAVQPDMQLLASSHLEFYYPNNIQ